jgi:hypothetical protein
MNRFIDISLMLVSGIIEASNDEGCIRENQHAVNKLRKERVFTQSGPKAASHLRDEINAVLPFLLCQVMLPISMAPLSIYP